MSENEEKPATGPVATDSSAAAPPLPTDGAAEAPADPAEAAEDRTTPANGSTANGAGVSAGPSAASKDDGAAAPVAPATEAPDHASAPKNGTSPAADQTAVFATPTPVPRPRPDAPSPGAADQPTGTPLPGSVPTPPPWRRASGSDATETAVPTSRPAPRQAPVDSLLSEAPTAYIDPGAAPRTASVGPARGEVHAGVPSVGERAPRQALLQLKRFDPWSVLKLALVLAVVLFFIWLVAVGVLYGVLDGMGVWDRLNGTYADLVSGGGQGGGGSLISAGSVFGFAAVIGAINSLLFAVAMTVGAFVYNVSADLVGGVEVTLSERD
ncbi:DUF3566 domain-containing protein [Pseudonocardia oroxyli]|uniref:DUF3566 domain-containing protein n=1 Tax=Pseudonocardia oroxyli TaxID=366584 RepID=A0A1G7LUQ9_PSEOR|nr:DUF3566 domain-containing protein [Pseudonocardia oroxyli]SDF52690.1 Transmembrane protein of unknown function [Pseudonocardia oroxyli]